MRPDPGVVAVGFDLAVPGALTAIVGQHVQLQLFFYHLTQSTLRFCQPMTYMRTIATAMSLLLIDYFDKTCVNCYCRQGVVKRHQDDTNRSLITCGECARCDIE